MSEEKKYVTFRDLRAVAPIKKPATSPTSTSTSSTPSTPSTPSVPDPGNASSLSTTVEEQKADTASAKSDQGSTSTPSNTSTPSTPSSTSITEVPVSSESRPKQAVPAEKPKRPAVAPERDFQRIPNSITRKAIPEGVFRGKSKQVWDYLWSITRGAVVPVTSTRKSRREIKAGSGLGSMVTVDAALEHLENVGLIAVRPAV